MSRASRIAPFAALALLCACHDRSEPVREELLVFRSPATIEIRGADAARARAAIAAVATELAGLERDWHPWEPSALTTVNVAFAAGRPATAPPSLRALLHRSRHFHELSDGLFDPAIGGLVALWGYHSGDFPIRAPPPGEAAIARWLAASPSLDDVLDEGGQLRARNRAVQLDFNAIAEGAAAERAAQILQRHGIEDALIELGGDVLALGDAGGRPWRVGIRDPRGGVLGGIALAGHEALFSSGNYAKYRDAGNGARWPHVLDPRSGRPATGTAAAAVLHQDPLLADVAATALLIAGPEAFESLLERMGIHCALLLTDRNELLITASMQARVELLTDPPLLRPPSGQLRACRP